MMTDVAEDREWFLLWVHLDGADRYLLWYSDQDDGVETIQGRIPYWRSPAEAIEHARRMGYNISPETPKLHDLDQIARAQDIFDASALLDAWNLCSDVARMLGRSDFLELDKRYHDEYNHLFYLSGAAPVSDAEPQPLSPREMVRAGKLLNLGTRMLRESLREMDSVKGLANNPSYSRQFGERDGFAIALSLDRDAPPAGDVPIDPDWGGLSLWACGRCLTRNISAEGKVSDTVRWNLTSICQWFIDVGVRLINEEPFPQAANSDKVRDACDWFNATETPWFHLAGKTRDEWFQRRSDWRQHHALRAAADAALPNVMMRRMGDFLEVSWDNESLGAPGSDIRFVEQRGTVLVSASRAAADLRDALVGATQALSVRCTLPAWAELAAVASNSRADDADWRWLIHRQTARVIDADLIPLRNRLNEHTKAQRRGLYVPHTTETLVLRNAGLESAKEIISLLDAAHVAAKAPMMAPIASLVRPSQPQTTAPWKEGYERALEVRDALEWGKGRVPDLRGWMKSNNVAVASHKLSSSVDLVTTRTEDHRASAVLNPEARSHLHREIGHATALGHILLDVTPVAVDGTWEHWPSAARARAFAVMLQLPEEGVREILPKRTNLRAEDVKSVMDRFNTGPYATTYHLRNLGFIRSDEHRLEILRDLT